MSEYLLAAIELLSVVALGLAAYAAIMQVKKSQVAFPVKFILAACFCAAAVAISLGISNALGKPSLKFLDKALHNPQAPAPNPPNP